MPPKAKITKDDVLKVSFELTKEKGFENLNARNIAEKLGCSTQPIFRIYSNMAELKKELFEYINQYFGQYIMDYPQSKEPFLCMGLAYIDFAKNERNLFKMLCLSDNLDMNSFSELVNQNEHGIILKDISNPENISADKIQTLFMNIWLFTHGVATMISTNSLDIPKEEIELLLQNAFKAFSTLVQTRKEDAND